MKDIEEALESYHFMSIRSSLLSQISIAAFNEKCFYIKLNKKKAEIVFRGGKSFHLQSTWKKERDKGNCRLADLFRFSILAAENYLLCFHRIPLASKPLYPPFRNLPRNLQRQGCHRITNEVTKQL